MHQVYTLSASTTPPRVKIGYSSCVSRRMRELWCKHGPLTLVRAWTFTTRAEAERAERALHWHCRDHAIASDWTDLGEARQHEWFDIATLHRLQNVDIDAVVKAYRATRSLEVRLAKADLAALRANGLTVEDCVRRAVDAG